MTTFLTANSTLPPYMAFPSFLLDCDFSETTKLLYMVLLNRARLSQKNDGWIDKKGHTKLGYARPVILDSDGNVEAVLDNAYDIIVTSEINGVDELEFKLPFQDSKRAYIDNEKTVRIVSDTYRIRTITDDKEESGKAITTVYAEAAFYDLAYSVKKDEITFNADTADVPMAYALQGTDS